MQCSLKLLLAQAWADHKATCDLCHITHRHLFSATQHFLYAFQQENQILRADLRATTYTRFSAAVRNKGKVTGKADFKLKSWPTGEDLSYYTSPESASLKPIIPTYLPRKKQSWATRLCKHFQVLKRWSQSSFPLVVCMSSSELLNVCIAL